MEVSSEEDPHRNSNPPSPRKRKRSSFDDDSDGNLDTEHDASLGKSASGSISPPPTSKLSKVHLENEEQDEEANKTQGHRENIHNRDAETEGVDGASDSNGEEAEGEDAGDPDVDSSSKSAEESKSIK